MTGRQASTVSTGFLARALVERRTWAELAYSIICLPLAVLGFVFVVLTTALGIVTSITFVGLPLLAAGGLGARGLGAVNLRLLAALLDERVEPPPPFKGAPGLLGWVQAALRDGVAWRARAYLLGKLPLTVITVLFVIGWVTSPYSVVYQLATGGFLGALVALLVLLGGPWVLRSLVWLDRRLAHALLGVPAREARVAELEEARSRIAEDAAVRLRRIERDLHDGTQAQLSALAMKLGQAKEKLEHRQGVPYDPAGALSLVDSTHRHAKEALAELRDIVRGIHPPALDLGLEPALQTLAARSTVPVDAVGKPAGTSQSSDRDGRLLQRNRASCERPSAREPEPNRDKGHRGDRQAANERLRRRRRGRGPRRRHRAGRPEDAPGIRRRPPRDRKPGRRSDADQRRSAPFRLNVVIAEDAAVLRDGLVRLLEDRGHRVVAAVADGESLVYEVGRHQPDVAIVDIRLPPTRSDEGLRAAIRIRGEHPAVGVLLFSQYIETRYASQLLAGNAAGVGYLLKDRVADTSDFLDALARVASGGTALDPEVVSQLVAASHRAGTLAEILTPRERDVLALMAEGRSNAAIAAGLVVSEGAVEKHVANIFTKLQLPVSDADNRRVLAVLRYLGR